MGRGALPVPLESVGLLILIVLVHDLVVRVVELLAALVRHPNAGAVLVLCQQYRDTGDEAYLREAQNALSYLENRRLESGQGVTRLEKAEGSPVCSLACFRTETVLPVANLLT